MTDLTPIPLPRALSWPPLVAALQALTPKFGAPIYLVGGAVRDALLNRAVHDLDLVIGQDGARAARIIANAFGGAFYPLDAERDVGRAIIEFEGVRTEIDVSRFRGATLADDLAGRDFTVNALAIPLDSDLGAVIDPLGGLADLHQRRLRRCTPNSIADDPIRALRAVRQSVALKLLIEPATREDVRTANLASISPERIRDELIKTLDGPHPAAALRGLDTLGLLAQIIPEVTAMHGVTQSAPHVFDVWEHTLKVVEALDRVLSVISPGRTDSTAADGTYAMIVFQLDRFRARLQTHLAETWAGGRSSRSLLMLGALLHDCGKPATRTVDDAGHIHFYQHEVIGAAMAHTRGIALRLSNDEVERLTMVVRQHMRPMHLSTAGTVTRRANHRFWTAAGAAGLDVCVLTQADYVGIHGVTLTLQKWLAFLAIVDKLLDGYLNEYATIVAPPTLINGKDLIDALSLQPGPIVGRLLRAISEAQAVGEVESVDQAVALARGLLASDTSEEVDS